MMNMTGSNENIRDGVMKEPNVSHRSSWTLSRPTKPAAINSATWGALDGALLTRMMDENAKLDQPLDAREVTLNAIVESAETVTSYFVNLICGERTGRVERVVRVPGFSAIDM